MSENESYYGIPVLVGRHLDCNLLVVPSTSRSPEEQAQMFYRGASEDERDQVIYDDAPSPPVYGLVLHPDREIGDYRIRLKCSFLPPDHEMFQPLASASLAALICRDIRDDGPPSTEDRSNPAAALPLLTNESLRVSDHLHLLVTNTALLDLEPGSSIHDKLDRGYRSVTTNPGELTPEAADGAIANVVQDLVITNELLRGA